MTEPVLTVELTELPETKDFEPGIRRAPNRGYDLGRHDTMVALKNALRYVPEEHHDVVAPERVESESWEPPVSRPRDIGSNQRERPDLHERFQTG